jgi:hypothetical protein
MCPSVYSCRHSKVNKMKLRVETRYWCVHVYKINRELLVEELGRCEHIPWFLIPVFFYILRTLSFEFLQEMQNGKSVRFQWSVS